MVFDGAPHSERFASAIHFANRQLDGADVTLLVLPSAFQSTIRLTPQMVNGEVKRLAIVSGVNVAGRVNGAFTLLPKTVVTCADAICAIAVT